MTNTPKGPEYSYGEDSLIDKGFFDGVSPKPEALASTPSSIDERVVPHVTGRESIVISSPGDPGYEEMLARHQLNQDMIQAAADAVRGNQENPAN